METLKLWRQCLNIAQISWYMLSKLNCLFHKLSIIICTQYFLSTTPFFQLWFVNCIVVAVTCRWPRTRNIYLLFGNDRPTFIIMYWKYYRYVSLYSARDDIYIFFIIFFPTSFIARAIKVGERVIVFVITNYIFTRCTLYNYNLWYFFVNVRLYHFYKVSTKR